MVRSCCLRTVADVHYNPWSTRTASINRNSDHLKVSFGQATFNAEGLEQTGIYFSRQMHWPGGKNSGVTIGRGYDMGSRTPFQIVRELTIAGMPKEEATVFASAAGLRGEAAERYVRNRRNSAPVMSLEVQKRLFEEIVTPEIVGDIRRIFSKQDTVARYGSVRWEELPTVVQELLFDLRYRGDYTPRTREQLQPALVRGDYARIGEIIKDTSYWASLGVPAERIRQRQELFSLSEGLPQHS